MSVFDLVGVGVGPFNLSVAALMEPISRKRSIFLEKKPNFEWHPGMLLPHSLLQTSFLKDLVTSADPTNPFSFLSYLTAHGRLYRFINADYPFIERREFADYMKWVAQRLPNLLFNQEVVNIKSHSSGFIVYSQDKNFEARNIVVATGIQPNIPDWSKNIIGENCTHSHEYMSKEINVANKNVVIIGGGQSGIEILLNIMNKEKRPASLTLLTRRQTLEALEDSPFSNEFFTPDYVKAFLSTNREKKHYIVNKQKLASDGVSSSTLKHLIQRLYACDFLDYDDVRPRILPNREVKNIEVINNSYVLQVKNHFNETSETIVGDVVLLSTGYISYLPDCLNEIKPFIPFDEFSYPLLNDDFSIACDFVHGGKIYIQNLARYNHGIADPQLSLGAWRSANIINSIMGKTYYYINDSAGTLQW